MIDDSIDMSSGAGHDFECFRPFLINIIADGPKIERLALVHLLRPNPHSKSFVGRQSSTSFIL
jgi:hypothetical protein